MGISLRVLLLLGITVSPAVLTLVGNPTVAVHAGAGTPANQQPDFTVTAVAISPDGKFVAAASAAATVIVWDAENGRQIWKFEGPAKAFLEAGPAFSQDGKLMAMVYSEKDNRIVLVWEFASGKVLHKLQGSGKPMVALGFADSGQMVVALERPCQVRRWDVKTGREGSSWDAWEVFKQQNKAGDAILKTAAFSLDGKAMAFIGLAEREKKVMQYPLMINNPGTGKEQWNCGEGQPLSVAMAFSSDCSLLGLSVDGQIQVRHAQTGKVVHQTPEADKALAKEADRWRDKGADKDKGLSFAPYALFDMIAKGGDVITVMDAPEMMRGLLERYLKMQGHNTGSITRLQFIAATQSSIERIERRPVAISIDGSSAAVMKPGPGETAQIWDMSKGKKGPEVEFAGPYAGLQYRGITFFPDGKRVLAASNGNLAVWDIVEGKELLKLPINQQE